MGAPRRGTPRREDAERHAKRHGDERRDSDEEEVLGEERRELGRVRGPELEQPHESARPCSAAAASSERLEHRAHARVSARSRSPPASRARRARRRRARRSAWPADSASAMSCVTMTIVLRTRGLDAPELAVQLAARDRIERAERLVHQQDRRIGRERARHADALPLPAGQMLGPPRRELAQPAGPRGASSSSTRVPIVPRPSRAAAARRRCCRARSGAERGRRPGGRSRCGGADRRDPSPPRAGRARRLRLPPESAVG